MPDQLSIANATRRAFIAGATAVLVVRPAQATPETMAAAIRQVAGDAKVTPGNVKIDLAPLVENGNSVALGVSVDSPMTETEYVESIHLFNQKNPQPFIAASQNSM